MSTPRVVCLGEALIDLIAVDDDGRNWRAAPGGAPYNAAIAAARLGAPAAFLGVLSSDLFGDLLRRHLAGSGVDHRHCPTTEEPTTLALVHSDDFSFHVAGTTALSAAANELHLPPDIGVLHVSGSVSLVLEPAASRLGALLAAAQHRALVHVDANPRPRVIDRERFLRRFDHWLDIADIVKSSADDIAWMYPDADPIITARHWVLDHQDGDRHVPGVVIVTRGADGATVLRADDVIDVPARSVRVVDTVGAGDTFAGAVLAALSAHRIDSRDALDRLDGSWWRTAATFACEAASLTCTRAGADPPRRSDL